jgi:hypothetical protein
MWLSLKQVHLKPLGSPVIKTEKYNIHICLDAKTNQLKLYIQQQMKNMELMMLKNLQIFVFFSQISKFFFKVLRSLEMDALLLSSYNQQSIQIY